MERSLFRYRFGTAEFDEARFELRVAGLPVEVERRALEVLAHLLRHSGEAVTKNELLSEVWAGRVTVENVLPNAINKLRRAVGEANAAYITTLPRVGYRLDGTVNRVAVGRQASSLLELSAGQAVPARPHFILQKQLGRSAGSEVWLAEHQKTREQRVYKFALEAGRLRGLKREVTLLRLLRESLSDASHVVEVLDWSFESPPYFLEFPYVGQTLTDWAAQHLQAMDTAARISLFLQIADVVAAAHAIGVLHKDLKPANILVSGDAKRPHVHLTDFGSGLLLEPDRLDQLGITQMGMTVEDSPSADSLGATPLYIAPEHFEGHAPSVKSDIYALGILLYQLLTGRIGLPMASGWEHEITNPQLREDLRLASSGNPAQRLNSVAELATRLRSLEARRLEAERAEAVRTELEASQQRLALASARKPLLMGLIAVLVIGLCVTAWLAQSAVQSRQRAELALAEAKALNEFLSQDLISGSNPAVMARGSGVLLRDALTDAATRVATRFVDQPTINASVHHSLAELFNAIDLLPEAEAAARTALTLHTKAGKSDSLEAQKVQSTLAVVLARRSKFEESDTIIGTLLNALPGDSASSDQQRYLLNYARALNLNNKSAYAAALPHFVAALEALARAQPHNLGAMNALRRDHIQALTVAGRYAEAEERTKSFLAELQQREGDQSLWIALVKRSGARSIGNQGRLEEAERLLLEAEPVIAERFGADSRQSISLLAERLAVATRKKDFDAALSMAEKLYAAHKSQFGAEHPQTAKALSTWGFVAFEAEQDKRADMLLRESCAILEKSGGAKSGLTQNCYVLLTLTQVASGRMREAGTLLQRLDFDALDTFRKIEGQREILQDGVQGLIDLSQGQASGRQRVASALRAYERSVQPKDRFYRMLKAAAHEQ